MIVFSEYRILIWQFLFCLFDFQHFKDVILIIECVVRLCTVSDEVAVILFYCRKFFYDCF